MRFKLIPVSIVLASALSIGFIQPTQVMAATKKVVKPVIFNSTDNINIKLIDPRSKKKINQSVNTFWVDTNRNSFALYKDKTLDSYYANIRLTEIWSGASSKGYGVEAAMTPNNNKEKGIWLVKSFPGTDYFKFSPRGTGCDVLGSTVRFKAALYTCIAVGNFHQYDEGVVVGSDHSDGVLGDGYEAGAIAPTRQCYTKGEVVDFFGATLLCSFMPGIRAPQISNAITIWNPKVPAEIYCVLDKTLAKQEQTMVGFIEYVLITSSCAKYFGNKNAKY